MRIDTYKDDAELSVMSFNIRFDNEEDGENKWTNRKQACIKMLNEIEPKVLCIQEGLYNQVRFLNENLQDYEYVGVGRDDGHSGGEHSAIFYSKSTYDLLLSGNFWLSETPDVPSVGWDANNIRIVSWAKLRDKEHNKELYVFNTHFDHKGRTAQSESSKLLVKKIEEIAGANVPIVLTGDFNMVIGSSRMRTIIENYLSARRFAHQSDSHRSFNGWGRWYLKRNIDFIFYHSIESLSFSTIVDNYDVPFLSDHYPIISYFKY